MKTDQETVSQSIPRFLMLEVVGDFLYWPIWWYTRGLQLTSLYIIASLRRWESSLGVRLMFVHLFQPMYGQNDREGRIISFFMRLILLIVRLIGFILISLGWLCLWLLWIAVPIVVVIRLVSFFTLS
jgi:hypothetical protein